MFSAHISCLLVLIHPRPTLSPLFPYTTLFRSHSAESSRFAWIVKNPFLNRSLRIPAQSPKSKLLESRACAPKQSVLRQTHEGDRKSTRLNSSHANISYAVFCLKKKKKQTYQIE